jgi:hypothetical protein
VARGKQQRILDDNRAAERRLAVELMDKSAAAFDGVDGGGVSQRQITTWMREATVGHFAKVNAPLLKAFIGVRANDAAKPPRGGYPGKLKEVDAVPGANTLIRLAYDARATDPKMKRLPPKAAPTAPVLPSPTVRSLDDPATAGRKASECLGSDEWCGLADSVLNPNAPPRNAAADASSRSDLLQAKLRARLPAHIRARVKDPAKQDHLIWDWAARNLGAAAAVVERLGHSKADLEAACDGRSLLAKVGAFETVGAGNAHLSGAYLHYDTEEGHFIRAGKVVRFNDDPMVMGKRGQEHAVNSKLDKATDMDSVFYTSYPAKSVSSARPLGRKRLGYSDNLTHHVAVSFDPHDQTTVDALTTGNLLEWPDDVVEFVAKLNIAGCTSTADKQLHMVGYLFELVYDLALSRSANISRSPGFESALGIFSGSDE